MAEVAGLEPANVGIKIRCLTNLAKLLLILYYGRGCETRTHSPWVKAKYLLLSIYPQQ